MIFIKILVISVAFFAALFHGIGEYTNDEQ